MIVKLLTERHLGFLRLKEGCRGSSASTHVKMSTSWKSHAAAHFSALANLHNCTGVTEPNSHVLAICGIYANKPVSVWLLHASCCWGILAFYLGSW